MSFTCVSEINDIREPKMFKGISFSKFKKSDVKKELLNSLFKSKIEPACYWSAELICAGHYSDLWDIILHFYSKNIHIGNSKLAIFLDLRIQHFKEIINVGYLGGNELKLRNNLKIRKLFCEIICILCICKRQHSFNDIVIKADDFDLTNITDKFKAPSSHYADDVILKDDPKELSISTNELLYNLSSDCKNNINACYWIEWMVEFEIICKNKKMKLKCERRSYFKVDTKYQMDIIWIIWDVLLKESETHCKLTQKIVKSLLNLFCLKYSGNCCKKRKYILYFVVSLLTENVNLKDDILREEQKEMISLVVERVDNIYKQIKQQEESPGMDYLFKNVKNTNFEKTIEKLDKMNSFNEEFVPRN